MELNAQNETLLGEDIVRQSIPLDVFPLKIQKLILDLNKFEGYNVEYLADSDPYQVNKKLIIFAYPFA